MSGNALILANLINNARGAAGLIVLTPNTISTGVGQWHADDMAANGYIGLVASDGEAPFRRIVCSGGIAARSYGAVAVGYTTDPTTAYNAIMADLSASATVLNNSGFWDSIGVGYSNGYWMVIVGDS